MYPKKTFIYTVSQDLFREFVHFNLLESLDVFWISNRKELLETMASNIKWGINFTVVYLDGKEELDVVQ